MATTDTPLGAIVDYILNKATVDELEVVQASVERRIQQDKRPSVGGMARTMARRIQDQLTDTVDVPAMARRLAEQLMRQKQPDMPLEHMTTLLDAWVPGSAKGASESPDQAAGADQPERRLPPDALLAMVAQFVAYSVGAMPPSKQAELPSDWPERYWQVFSGETRQLISQLLRGQTEIEQFWATLRGRLGLPPEPA